MVALIEIHLAAAEANYDCISLGLYAVEVIGKACAVVLAVLKGLLVRRNKFFFLSVCDENWTCGVAHEQVCGSRGGRGRMDMRGLAQVTCQRTGRPERRGQLVPVRAGSIGRPGLPIEPGGLMQRWGSWRRWGYVEST